MLNCGLVFFMSGHGSSAVFRWVGWFGVSCDFGIERHLSPIWRWWCHAHDVRCCVRVMIAEAKVLVPDPSCVRVVVSHADQVPSAERP